MIACFFITISALIQLLLTVWYRNQMRQRPRPTLLPAEEQHSTWIVFGVRGADPTLADAVRSLLNQNFREYKICVVVDSQLDPANSILQSVANESRLLIRHLQNPLSTCTLKCSAIAEGVERVLEVDPDVKYFVMVDADSDPPPNMIATLTGALYSNPQAGLASGNQWFEPKAPSSVGSMVRSMWYAGALFFSMLFQNPWAGAYAMRASDIRETGLISVWRKSAVDDGPLKQLLAKQNLSCLSLPSMVMVNRESCTLGFVTRWMSRILTWSRIHEPGFWLTAIQMTFASSLIVAIFSTLGWAIWAGDVSMVLWTTLSIVASGIMSVLAWTTIRRSVIETSDSAIGLEPIGVPRFVGALLVVAVAQAVYAIACIRAIVARKITWRGVTYLIQGRSLRLDQYVPFEGEGESKHSI
ncbi:glycosyltransferase family 2 protein [Mariniblastus fucicola]|uniref:Glycosyl transferase family 2 n=1 Tax=Mariniblastus fucicola TaxID=980251 RepID=A0A5B9P5L6_9BACT|nr:glycosyltransferase family 2 protein [Mariniblastus fucicola]QEG21554.1 Glycosyl transferase family 2 [Mariniblastus fucicola]